MGKSNHLRPIHTGGTTGITTRGHARRDRAGRQSQAAFPRAGAAHRLPGERGPQSLDLGPGPGQRGLPSD